MKFVRRWAVAVETPQDRTDNTVSVSSVSPSLVHSWDEIEACRLVSDTIEAVTAKHVPGDLAPKVFAGFDQAVAEACKAEDIEAEREAVKRLRAAVVIEAHGERFVILPDGEDPAPWAARGLAPLSVSEVVALAAGNRGDPLDADVVKAIAATKRQFPDASVLSARDLRSEVQP